MQRCAIANNFCCSWAIQILHPLNLSWNPQNGNPMAWSSTLEFPGKLGMWWYTKSCILKPEFRTLYSLMSSKFQSEQYKLQNYLATKLEAEMSRLGRRLLFPGRARCRQTPSRAPFFPEPYWRSGSRKYSARTLERWTGRTSMVQVVSKIGVIKKLPTKFKHIGYVLMGK